MLQIYCTVSLSSVEIWFTNFIAQYENVVTVLICKFAVQLHPFEKNLFDRPTSVGPFLTKVKPPDNLFDRPTSYGTFLPKVKPQNNCTHLVQNQSTVVSF